MGFYLNSRKPYLLFREEARALYFVDKSEMIEELIPLIGWSKATPRSKATPWSKATPQSKATPWKDSGASGGDNPEVDGSVIGSRYICITRPRRFGKTVAANMISAYFGKGIDSSGIFRNLKVHTRKWYKVHLNQYHCIHIMCNEMPDECASYGQYISRIKRRLMEDLMREFPHIPIHREDALWDALNSITEFGQGERFIFVLDEWDFIFHRRFISEEDKASYIGFLSSLLKDQPYVEFVYMTGILPISKYSSGSELNMFFEYTMASRKKYSEYFGFTDSEVDTLYQRYLRTEKSPMVDREGLRLWYDGYQAASGTRLYNPRSVVGALGDNQLGSFWTSTGPYDEIFYYVGHNVGQVREDLALMVSGTPVPAKVQEYAATSMNLSTRDEIFSAMVVYGFLSYREGCVSIPNRELMDKFADMLRKEPSLGYVHRLARESGRMLQATKSGDTETMAKILEYAHNTESPLLCYSNEAELAAVVRLVYLEARDTYRVEREDKAGTGYADFLFYPEKPGDDCIVIELKVDGTAEEAVQQIKDRKYALNFQEKPGEKVRYTGRVLAVGIGYAKKDKRHECRVEVLRDRRQGGIKRERMEEGHEPGGNSISE